MRAAPLKNVLKKIDEVKIADENKCICSYTVCGVLAVTALATSIGIGADFAYSCWYFKKDVTRINFGTRAQWNYIQTTI